MIFSSLSSNGGLVAIVNLQHQRAKDSAIQIGIEPRFVGRTVPPMAVGLLVFQQFTLENGVPPIPCGTAKIKRGLGVVIPRIHIRTRPSFPGVGIQHELKPFHDGDSVFLWIEHLKSKNADTGQRRPVPRLARESGSGGFSLAKMGRRR